jgi:hypothetical protein
VGTSAGFRKVSPKIIRPFPEVGPRTTRRRKGKRKYSGKTLGKKIVKNFITVDSVSKCKTE